MILAAVKNTARFFMAFVNFNCFRRIFFLIQGKLVQTLQEVKSGAVPNNPLRQRLALDRQLFVFRAISTGKNAYSTRSSSRKTGKILLGIFP